jgi:Tfp pilus assembly protein FimT
MRAFYPRAFSLLEVIFTVGLLGLSAALFALSGSGLKSKPQVEALAHVLANEFGQARLLAIRQQSPVALVFPGGGKPHSTSLYQLEGISSPRITRAASFAGDFPGLTLFVGSWNNETRDPLVVDTKWSRFPLETWIPTPSQNDYAFIFMPDGTVRTNDLPQFDREYHVVVSAGVGGYVAQSVPGGSLPVQPETYRPTALGDSRTVCLNAGGAVRIDNGLTGSSLIPRGKMASLTPPAPARQVTFLGSAEGDPKGTSSLPAPQGSEPTTVPPDGFVTLTTFAADLRSSGERLFCSWKVIPTATASTGLGAYSIPVSDNAGAAMDFNPLANLGTGGLGAAFQSSWQWRPPADAQPGDIFTMALLLQNQQKQLVDVQIEKKLKVLPYGHILFESDRQGTPFLYRMNPDGTGQRRFHIRPSKPSKPLAFAEYWPAASGDGQRIVFLSDRGPGPADIFLTDFNGDEFVALTSGQRCEAPCLSPAGDRVAFKRWAGGSFELCTMSVAGGAYQVLDTGLSGAFSNPDPVETQKMREDRIAWREDGTVFYTKANQLHAVTLNASGAVVAAAGPAAGWNGAYGSWSPYWSPQSNSLYYTRDDGAGPGDPLVGKDQAIYSLSEFWNEGQPCSIQYGTQEWMLTVRTSTTVAGPDQIYLIQPAPPGDPLMARALTSQGANRCPVYLR